MDCPKISFLQAIAIIFVLMVVHSLLLFDILEASSEYISNEYIVILRDDIVVNPQDIADEMASSFFNYPEFEVGHVYQSALKGFSAVIPEEIYQDVILDERVDYIETDRYLYVEYDEYDSLLSLSYKQEKSTGLMRTELDLYMHINGTDRRIDAGIAIIDTGIDLDHPDLNVRESISFTGTESGDDDIGHGTHMAGIAAALDNDIGVVGMAPGARLYAIKVLEKDIEGRARGKLSWVIAAVDWVTTAKDLEMIDVVNMGMVGRGNSDALRKAIRNSINKGVVYVVAAGDGSEEIYGCNEYGCSEEDPNYDLIPAAFPEVATISAMADFDGYWGGKVGFMEVEFMGNIYDMYDDTMAPFSNYSSYEHPEKQIDWPDVFEIGALIYGEGIDLAAPGVNILSTYRGGKYTEMSGTAMASAHVAGLMALYIAQYGKANYAEDVKEIREDFIYSSEPQCLWIPLADPNFCIYGDTLTYDPDWNPEGLVNAKFITDSPEVEIINPIEDEEVEGKIYIIARIISNDPLEKVEYSIDDGKYYQMEFKMEDNDSVNQYQIKWNTEKEKNGDCPITVRAITTTGWIGYDTVSADIEDDYVEIPDPQWWLPISWPFCQGPECNVAIMGLPVYGSLILQSPDFQEYMSRYDEMYGPYGYMSPYLEPYYPGQSPPPAIGFYTYRDPSMVTPSLRLAGFSPVPPFGYGGHAGYAPPSIGFQNSVFSGFGPNLGPVPPFGYGGYAGYAPPSIGPQNPAPPNVGLPSFGPPNLGSPSPIGTAGYAPPSIGPQNPAPPSVGLPSFGPPNLGPPSPIGTAGYASPSIGPQNPAPPNFGLPPVGQPRQAIVPIL